MLNQNGMLNCSCLASTQEGADTRIILHALYSGKLFFTKLSAISPKVLNLLAFIDCNKGMSSLIRVVQEINTRIILHALYSDKLYQENNVQGCIVVKSPDTEVLVLYVHYFPKMKNTSELWFQTGLIRSTKDCRRSILVQDQIFHLSNHAQEVTQLLALEYLHLSISLFGMKI
jgi:hypothetical protein